VVRHRARPLFRGGQILWGLVGLATGLIVLVVLKQVEERMKHDRQGTVSIVIDPSGPAEDEIRSGLLAAGIQDRVVRGSI